MRQLQSIQVLRALAALMVVVGHAQSEAAVAALRKGLAFTPLPLLPWGAGVDLFFAISGFIMVVASGRLFAAPGAPATFLARRLKRIVPLYWAATTLYVGVRLATHQAVGGLDLAASYLFWPRNVYGDGVLRPIYQLGWTLDYEMFFYALFATAIVLPRRLCVVAVTAALVAGVAATRLWPPLPGPLAFWSQPIVLEFAFGMIAGLAWCEGWRLPRPAAMVLAALATGLLVYDPMDAAHRAPDWITPNDLARVAAWGLPCAMLLTAAALARPRAPWAETTVGGLVPLGDASYALYLVHPFVIAVLIRAYAIAGLPARIGYWPLVVGCIAAAVATALLLHRRGERPLARWLDLRRLDGKPTLAAVDGGSRSLPGRH